MIRKTRKDRALLERGLVCGSIASPRGLILQSSEAKSPTLCGDKVVETSTVVLSQSNISTTQDGQR